MKVKRIVQLFFAALAAVSVARANPIPERVKGLEREPCEFRCVGPGGGGWIQSMLLSRHDRNRFFVGCDVGGFYYSEDGGRSYEMRNRGLKHLFIETIAEHPTNPDVLFLGSQGGIYKTTDRGRTWQEKRTGLPPVEAFSHSIQISKFAFLPGNPEVLFAIVGQPRTGKGARGEIWRSDDGGESWRMIVKNGLAKDVNLFDITIDPRDGNRMLVASNHGLFRSENGGVDWVPSNEGLPSHLRTRHLARCPAQPDIVYVTLRQQGGEKPWSAGIYRSADGGRTWEARNGGIDRRYGNSGCDDELCTWTDCIAVHPTNPDIVWTGGASWWYTGILKTEDGGRSWKQVFNADRGWISFWGPSVKTMTLSAADPGCLAFGTSGMVYATQDGGANWEQRYYRDLGNGHFTGTGLEVTCLHAVVPSVHRQGRVYLGYYDIGLLVSDDDGKSMRRMMKGIPYDYSNSCFALAEAPDDAQLLWGGFGSWGGGGKAIIARSFDGAETWQPCTNAASGWNGAAPSSLLVLGKKPNYQLMAAGAKGLQLSADGGVTWRTPVEQFAEAGRVRFLARGGDTVYAAVCGNASEGASVFACRADGRWERLTPPQLRIADLHGLAADGDRVLVTARDSFNHQTREFRPGGAWLSTDAGATWKKVWTDAFVDATVISRGELYISLADNPFHDHCGGAGVLHSVDDGATWTYLDGPTLQNWNVHALAMDPFVPRRLWMGTCGNSVFVLEKGKTRNTALVPRTKIERDGYDWFARHERIMAHGRELNPEIVFLGDSITHFWAGRDTIGGDDALPRWKQAFGSWRTLNLGYGWDRTGNLLWRIGHGEMDGIDPRVVVLHIGGNNFSTTKNYVGNTAEEVAEAVLAVMDAARAKAPRAKLVVMGIFPFGEYPNAPHRVKARAANAILAREVPKRANAVFIDITESQVGPDGRYSKDMARDFVHPTDAGYDIWSAALLPHLRH